MLTTFIVQWDDEYSEISIFTNISLQLRELTTEHPAALHLFSIQYVQVSKMNAARGIVVHVLYILILCWLECDESAK